MRMESQPLKYSPFTLRPNRHPSMSASVSKVISVSATWTTISANPSELTSSRDPTFPLLPFTRADPPSNTTVPASIVPASNAALPNIATGTTWLTQATGFTSLPGWPCWLC